ncbi:MAG: class I SAM-dependent methyltransferase [Thermoanaerobacteraceae bacterium]|nr:class I SAM-dependent methyltransferase [Thermoanaerobacteraceae bacterium]
MTPNCVVTTSLKAGAALKERAVWFSRRLGVPLVPRHKLSLEAICAHYGVSGVLVVSAGRVSYFSGGRELFFHPGMAVLRIKEIKAGKTDQMIKAMDLKRGDRLLDCTLGPGVDALVAAWVVGEEGRVVGVESSPVLAALVEHGLAGYGGRGSEDLDRARTRVEVVCADHLEYLRSIPRNSFDVVYFDPMFRCPLRLSSAMEPVRGVANPQPLRREALQEALRVARRRVVVKETRESGEFARLGIRNVQGGKYSPVAYGVLVKEVGSGV